MSMKLFNVAAFLLIMAASCAAMAAHPQMRKAGGHCSSGDGSISCECDGKCWADGTSCGCLEGAAR